MLTKATEQAGALKKALDQALDAVVPSKFDDHRSDRRNLQFSTVLKAKPKLPAAYDPDAGLVVLDSLKAWRHSGWQVGAGTYGIRAFTECQGEGDERTRRRRVPWSRRGKRARARRPGQCAGRSPPALGRPVCRRRITRRSGDSSR